MTTGIDADTPDPYEACWACRRSMDDPNEVFFLLSISDMDRAGVLEGKIHYVEDVG